MVHSFTGMGLITEMDYRNGHLCVLEYFSFGFWGQIGLEYIQTVISSRSTVKLYTVRSGSLGQVLIYVYLYELTLSQCQHIVLISTSIYPCVLL